MSLIKNILAFLVAFIMSLTGLELYLRKTEIITRSLNKFDDKLGRIRRSDAPFLDFNEGFGIGSFNEYGYLGPGYPREKKEGTLRVALMGDSYVEGFQVFDRQHFRYIFERELSERLQKPVEVLNFGRSGFGLEDIYLYDTLFASQFNPDIVLYFVSNENLYSFGRRSFLPQLVWNNKDANTMEIRTQYLYAGTYKKQLSLQQNSAIAQMGRNVYNQLKDRELSLKKIFDKFYWPEILQNNQKQTTSLINKEANPPDTDPAHLFILNEMRKKGILIVNHGQVSLQIPEEFQDLIILNVNELFTQSQQYNWDYHKWKASGKSGHWNYEGHELLGRGLSGCLKICM